MLRGWMMMLGSCVLLATSSAAAAPLRSPSDETRAPAQADEPSCPTESLAVGESKALPADVRAYSIGTRGVVRVAPGSGGALRIAGEAPGKTRLTLVLGSGAKRCVRYEVTAREPTATRTPVPRG